jgi:hypothetical protein
MYKKNLAIKQGFFITEVLNKEEFLPIHRIGDPVLHLRINFSV